jgi:hypothetical protein
MAPEPQTTQRRTKPTGPIVYTVWTGADVFPFRPWFSRLGDDGPQAIGWLIVFALLITACILKSHQ